MSQWTHINAVIRFDVCEQNDIPTPELLGKQFDFSDIINDNIPENYKLPAGSEGSLQYKILKVDDESIAQYSVVFFGDLRRYNDVNEIMQYFNNIISGKNIRSGIIEIDVEFDKIYIFHYNQEKEKFILVKKTHYYNILQRLKIAILYPKRS